MKKKTLSFVITTLMLSCVLFVSDSCAKYEDGPAVSLFPKRWRLSGTWEFEAYFENDVDRTTSYPYYNDNGYSLYIGADSESKTYEIRSGYVIGGLFEQGTWSWGTTKETLILTSTDPVGTVTEYKILRLKSKELWVQFEEASGVVKEIHFKQD